MNQEWEEYIRLKYLLKIYDTRCVMFGSRDNNNLSPASALVSSVNSKVHQIFTTLSEAFLAESENHSALFQVCWLKLNAIPDFPSVDELDKYYVNILETHDVYLRDYINQSQIEVSDSLKSILKNIIPFFHAIAKQKHYLSQLNPEDEFQLFNKNMQLLKLQIKALNGQGFLSRNYVKQIKKVLSDFSSILNQSATVIEEKQLADFSTKLTGNSVGEAQDAFVRKVRRLPNPTEITHVTSDQGYQDNPWDLRASMLSFREIVNELESNIKIRIDEQTKILNQLMTDKDAIERNLEGIDVYYKAQKSMKKILNINGYTNAKEVAQGYKDIEIKAGALITSVEGHIYLLGRFSYNRKPAWTKVHAALHHDLMNEFRGLVMPYLEQFSSLNACIENINQIKRKMSELNVFHAEESVRLAKTEALYKELHEKLKGILSILEGHIESRQSQATPNHFIKDHWGKILVAGGSFGSCGLGLALLLALDPSKIAVLIAGSSVVGGLSGALAGMVKNECFVKSKNPTDEEKGLLEENEFAMQDQSGVAVASEESQILKALLDRTAYEALIIGCKEDEQEENIGNENTTSYMTPLYTMLDSLKAYTWSYYTSVPSVPGVEGESAPRPQSSIWNSSVALVNNWVPKAANAPVKEEQKESKKPLQV